MKKLPTKIIILTILLLFLKVGSAQAAYNPNNVTEPSGLSVNQIYNLLEDTTYHYADIAETFYRAEKNYGVNSHFLVALSKFESGRGTNKLTKYNNNIFSFKNVDGSWKQFNSIQESIDFAARNLKKYYLTPGAKYFNGYGIKDIRKCYCPDGSSWNESINAIIFKEMKSKI